MFMIIKVFIVTGIAGDHQRINASVAVYITDTFLRKEQAERPVLDLNALSDVGSFVECFVSCMNVLIWCISIAPQVGAFPIIITDYPDYVTRLKGHQVAWTV